MVRIFFSKHKITLILIPSGAPRYYLGEVWTEFEFSTFKENKGNLFFIAKRFTEREFIHSLMEHYLKREEDKICSKSSPKLF